MARGVSKSQLLNVKEGIKMTISDQDLKEMNDLIRKGKTIADVAKQFYQYDYWDIYYAVSNYSFQRTKRSISNRLKKLKTVQTQEKRLILINEIIVILDYFYETSKNNGKKLLDIGKVLLK
jgi:hypothetical protein